jgi:hypothetical protein
MARRLGPRRAIVEVGGRNVNGSIRAMFAGPPYLGVDLVAGADVDLVADCAAPATHWLILDALGQQPDTVICCEVLEHTPEADAIVRNCLMLVEPGGYVILTCATAPRDEHSAIDGGTLRPGEFYRNVELGRVQSWLAYHPAVVELEETHPRGDLYVLIRRELVA